MDYITLKEMDAQTQVRAILEDDNGLTLHDLNELPIWALDEYCTRKNLCIEVEHGRVKGVLGGI